MMVFSLVIKTLWPWGATACGEAKLGPSKLLLCQLLLLDILEDIFGGWLFELKSGTCNKGLTLGITLFEKVLFLNLFIRYLKIILLIS